MRDTWYGDNRDLVKWGALLHLATRHQIQRLVQVAYFQSSSPPQLDLDGVKTPMPSAVWQHFRDLHQVQRLARSATLEISLIDWAFSHRDRAEYTQRLVEHLATLPSPKIVLLDPDTGIAPKHFNARHVTAAEVRAVWEALEPHDWLVLYQHARHSKTWLTDTVAEFNACCSGTDASIFRSQEAAPDVALFAARK